MPDWSILQNALQSNPGEGFRQGMARGLMGSAMQGNGNSLNALMGVDPGAAAAMQDRQSQLAARAEQTRTRELANRRNDIIMGASFLDGVVDQSGYAAALQRARAAGVNIEGAPEQFDQAYVDGVRQTAQSLIRATQRPQQPQGPTTLQRNYEYLRQTNPALAEQYLRNQAEGPPMLGNNGDGTFTIIPRAMINGGSPAPAAGPQPGTVEDGYRFRGGDPGDPNNWEPVAEGGSGSAAPSNFPGDEWIPTDGPQGIW